MATFSLGVTIDPSHLAQFRDNGFRLCLSNGVQSFNKLNYNVIASAQLVDLENYVVQFNDNYSMAATQLPTTPGVVVTASTEIQHINFGESYTLSADWVNATVAPDKDAPQDGFLFINQAPSATCVLFRTFGGDNPTTPIYVSAAGQLPPGTETIVPTNKVLVWFQVGDDLQGSVVSNSFHFKTTSAEVDFGCGHTSYHLTYDASGAWVVSSSE